MEYNFTQYNKNIKKYLTKSGKWEIIDLFSLYIAEELIDQHIYNIEKGVNILKIDRKRRLSRVIKNKKTYVVKEFTMPGPWWIFRPDAISWRNSHKLKALRIPVPEVYAWLQSKDKKGFIIMEDLGNQVLKEVLRKFSPGSSEREKLLKKIGYLVGYVHDKNIVYGDLKLTNVMIRGSRLFLIDMDKIKLKKRLSIKDKIYNLKQILASFPENIMDSEIDLFFETYFHTIFPKLLEN